MFQLPKAVRFGNFVSEATDLKINQITEIVISGMLYTRIASFNVSVII